MADFSYSYDRVLLDVSTYLKDEALLKRVRALDTTTQYAICELMYGGFSKHIVYLSKQSMPKATVDNLNSVIVHFDFTGQLASRPSIFGHLLDAMKVQNAPAAFTISLLSGAGFEGIEIPGFGRGVQVTITSYMYTDILCQVLKDEDPTTMTKKKRTLREIFAAVRTLAGVDIADAELVEVARQLLDPLIKVGYLVLMDSSVWEAIPSSDEVGYLKQWS